MTIQLQNLHPNAQTLASQIIDGRHKGTEKLEVDSLDSIEKRFLRMHEVSYSLNPNSEKWEIQL